MIKTSASTRPTTVPDQRESLEPLLKESIKQFLSQYRRGVSDFSDFDTIFTRLLQDLHDPPLEIVWFYSAVSFYSSRVAFQDPLKQIINFFQLLVSCSETYDGAQRIALLSPVSYHLSRLAVEKKEAKTDIVGLLEGIISYISIYSTAETKEDDEPVMSDSCFVDLACVWVADEVMGNETDEGCLGTFLPFATDEACKTISSGLQIGHLAGIVTSQFFLLRLCLKFGSGLTRSEIQKDLNDCIIQMINGFRSYHFLDTILKMLILENVLPVTLLLGPEDEIVLRDVLTNVVIKMENQFLNSEKSISQPHLKNFAIMWLLAVNKALDFYRRTRDQQSIKFLMTAFPESCIPSQLINWVISQNGSVKDLSLLTNPTPVDFLEWLLTLEDRGLQVFGSRLIKIYAKNALQRSRKESNDVEMAESLQNVATSPCSALTNGTRKRREDLHSEGQASVKLIKHRHDISVSSNFLPFSLSCATEVDATDMEQ